MDCSSTVSYCYLWSGASGSVLATGGMDAWPALPSGSEGPGDLALYGSQGNTHHVNMLLDNGEYFNGGGNSSADIMKDGPTLHKVSDIGDVYKYVRWPGVA